MANHKSALKRQRQNETQRARNKANKSRMKNAVKSLNEAMENKQAVSEVQELLKKTIPIIQGAATKGTIHKRKASRQVSKLTRKVNAFAITTANA